MKFSSFASLALRAGTLLIVLNLAVPASAAQRSEALPSCHAAVKSLTSEWDAVAFPEPSKPMQAHVFGHLGHENSGSEVDFMRTQIRLAVEDCDVGREEAAQHRVATVRSILDPQSTELIAHHYP
ncbi:MAG TPA: hypothetical protein VM689_08850 [Aliidongia sp.]|nr:hypothetical protein [Aliidongia sp.]